MGNCASLDPADQADADNTKKIDHDQRRAMKNEARVLKLLLLGPGESGKSTLFRRLKTLYGVPYSESDRFATKGPICNNIIVFMQMIVIQIDQLPPEQRAHFDQNFGQEAQLLRDAKEDEELTEEYAYAIDTLWKQEITQQVFTERSRFHVPDSASYFFDKVLQCATEGYCPSEEDCVRSRVRTTGIVETEFEIQGNRFRMLDVGGQKNERKKWIHCFDDVTAIIFVVAVSEYNQQLYEDEQKNRMQDSLQLFLEIANSPFFRNTSMVLFLNKKDLFAEKIKAVPLTVCFPGYKGRPGNYDDGIKFIEQQFVSLSQSASKTIYVHPTCGLDSNNIQIVFNAVKDIIVTRHLSELANLA